MKCKKSVYTYVLLLLLLVIITKKKNYNRSDICNYNFDIRDGEEKLLRKWKIHTSINYLAFICLVYIFFFLFLFSTCICLHFCDTELVREIYSFDCILFFTLFSVIYCIFSVRVCAVILFISQRYRQLNCCLETHTQKNKKNLLFFRKN